MLTGIIQFDVVREEYDLRCRLSAFMDTENGGEGIEVTELSTNKQRSLSRFTDCLLLNQGGASDGRFNRTRPTLSKA